MKKSNYNKGGRPSKEAAEKLKYKVTIKLATEDYYTLKSKAHQAGMTVSEFVRKVLGKGYVVERLYIEQMNSIRKLSGMANNLNQIAHRANAEGFCNVEPLHRQLIENIDNVLNMIRG